MMVEDRNDSSENYWEPYDNRGKVHDNSGSRSGDSKSLVFLVGILLGIGIYVSSFYWDRAPLPEVSRAQPNRLDTGILPVSGFEKNQG